jgi:septal ring factor EnvC (AmiA/AmiB activator)
MGRIAAIAALIAAPLLLGAAQEPAGVAQTSTHREIQELRAELARIAASGPQNTAEVAAAKARLQALNVRETALSARLGQDRNRLAKLLSALQLFRRSPPPALLVSPGDARDAVRAAILIRAMTPELERRAAVLSAEARAMAALRREAAAANAELFTAESAQAERRADIERLLDDQAAEDDSLFARSPGAMVTTLPASAAVGSLNRLTPPVPGPIVRPYGGELPSGGRAPGVTFAAPRGSPVRAPAQGVVEYAAPIAGWGVVLIIRAAGGHHLVLAGLTQATVVSGQSVSAGAQIGRMGDGGPSGPELYLEVRQGGAPVDPTRFLSPTSQRTAIR